MSVLTVRASKSREKLRKYNINVSETIRKMLEERVEELEQKDLEQRPERIKDRFGDKINSEVIAKLIRRIGDHVVFFPTHRRLFRS